MTAYWFLPLCYFPVPNYMHNENQGERSVISHVHNLSPRIMLQEQPMTLFQSLMHFSGRGIATRSFCSVNDISNLYTIRPFYWDCCFIT